MKRFKQNLLQVYVVLGFGLLFLGLYAIGKFFPTLGNSLADLFEFIIACIFITFVLAILVMPFFDEKK